MISRDYADCQLSQRSAHRHTTVMMDGSFDKLEIFFDSLSIDQFSMWLIISVKFPLVPQCLYSLLSRNRW